MADKKRVVDAIAAYYKSQQPKKKRARVEREEPVVESILYWAKQNGIMLRRYESKAVKHTIGGRTVWRNTGLDYGTPDLQGVGSGYAVAIEAKAPGRRNTLRPQQRQFLLDVIEQGGFGVVVDDVLTLGQWWSEFLERKKANADTRQWLLAFLPLMPGKETFDGG